MKPLVVLILLLGYLWPAFLTCYPNKSHETHLFEKKGFPNNNILKPYPGIRPIALHQVTNVLIHLSVSLYVI